MLEYLLQTASNWYFRQSEAGESPASSTTASGMILLFPYVNRPMIELWKSWSTGLQSSLCLPSNLMSMSTIGSWKCISLKINSNFLKSINSFSNDWRLVSPAGFKISLISYFGLPWYVLNTKVRSRIPFAFVSLGDLSAIIMDNRILVYRYSCLLWQLCFWIGSLSSEYS